MVSEVHKPKETEVKERKKIKASGTTKIKYKMLQLLFFKLLKITIGNKLCFLTACKTVVFPLKSVFQGVRVWTSWPCTNTGCLAVLFLLRQTMQCSYCIYWIKTLCTLPLSRKFINQTLLLNLHFTIIAWEKSHLSWLCEVPKGDKQGETAVFASYSDHELCQS